MAAKLSDLTDRYDEVSALLADPDTMSERDKFTALSKEFAELEPVIASYRRFDKLDSELDDARGQTSLGSMYQEGRGVPQDDAEAVKWFRRAASQRDARGQMHLAWMIQRGRGAPRDAAEAIKWFRRAARQGYARAQRFLRELGVDWTLEAESQDCETEGPSAPTSDEPASTARSED